MAHSAKAKNEGESLSVQYAGFGDRERITRGRRKIEERGTIEEEVGEAEAVDVPKNGGEGREKGVLTFNLISTRAANAGVENIPNLGLL